MFVNKIIGDKNEFAVEFLVTSEQPHVMGKICLWLGSKYIGYFDSPTVLGTALVSLVGVIKNFGNLTIPNSSNLTAKQISDRVNSDEPDGLSSIYLLTVTENTDDFLFNVYEEGEFLVFIWMLYENPSYNYPEYSHELNKFSVNKKVFEDVVFKFRDEIERIQNP